MSTILLTYILLSLVPIKITTIFHSTVSLPLFSSHNTSLSVHCKLIEQKNKSKSLRKQNITTRTMKENKRE